MKSLGFEYELVVVSGVSFYATNNIFRLLFPLSADARLGAWRARQVIEDGGLKTTVYGHGS